jgi:uncharacterized protein (TIGR02453 family)
MSETTRHFTPATFAFLRDLAENNNRDWFQANKERYERQVREPALQFIRDFAPYLQKISPFFRADDRKSGGSMFRIHRDVRFSKDKSPYKTHTGIHFRHVDAKDAHAPGFYLHLQPRQVFMGIGSWHPDGDAARMIREGIVKDAPGWKKAVTRKGFTSHYELGGDSLKRPPRGFDPDHALVEDLKRKDFMGVSDLTQKAVTSPGFLQEYAKLCKAGAPLVEFICRSVGVSY